MAAKNEHKTPAARDRVRFEQIKAILANQPVAIGMNSVIGLMTAAALHEQPYIEYWVVMLIFINVIRHIFIFSYGKKVNEKSNGKKFCYILNILTLCSSASWSFVPLFLADFTGGAALFLVCVMCGLATGSVVQGNSYAINPILFLSPILTCFGIKVALQGTFESTFLVINTLFFMFFLIRYSFELQNSFIATHMLKEEALSANTRLYELANHDPLTGLLNRAAFAASLRAVQRSLHEFQILEGLDSADSDTIARIGDV